MALCVTLFATTGVFGVLATYPHTDGDVLRSLPEDVIPARVAQLAVGVSLALVTPLIIWPIRTSLNTMIRACTTSTTGKTLQCSGAEPSSAGGDLSVAAEADTQSGSEAYTRLRGGSEDAQGGGINGSTPPMLRDAHSRVAHSRAAGDLASALHPPTVRFTQDGKAVVDDWDGARGERVVGPGAPSQGWSAPSPVLQGRALSSSEPPVVLRGRLSKRAGSKEHGTPQRRRVESSDSDWEDTPGRTAHLNRPRGLDESVDGISLPGGGAGGADGSAGAPLLSSDSDSRRDGPSSSKRRSRLSRRALFSLWWWKRLAVTAAVVLVSFGIAFGVPSVLIVFRLIGATAATFLFYIYPALVYLKRPAMGNITPTEGVQGGGVLTQGGGDLAGATASDALQIRSPDASSAFSTDTVGVTWVDGAVSISTPVQQRPGQLRTVAVSTTARIGSAGETSASDTDMAGPLESGALGGVDGGAGGVSTSGAGGARNIICGSSLCEGTQVVAVHGCARGGAYFLIFAGVALTALSLYSIIDDFVHGGS